MNYIDYRKMHKKYKYLLIDLDGTIINTISGSIFPKGISKECLNIENCDKLDLHFLKSCDNGQQEYLEMIDCNAKPQQARQVLPIALKTEINMCGFVSDWKHFFSLRSSHAGATGMHPDMDYIANKIYDEFLKRKYIN